MIIVVLETNIKVDNLEGWLSGFGKNVSMCFKVG